jgi:predicted RNase H-like HicB family nuclease
MTNIKSIVIPGGAKHRPGIQEFQKLIPIDIISQSQYYVIAMKHEFTAVIERDGDWFIAYCPEIPGANGQGKSVAEVKENLAEAIELILEDRREDGLRGVPPDAIREKITIQ